MAQKKEKARRSLLFFSSVYVVNPWGVEPQSKEPESFILSIELRVRVGTANLGNFWKIAKPAEEISI